MIITIIVAIVFFLNGLVTMDVVSNTIRNESLCKRIIQFLFCTFLGFILFIYQLVLMIKQWLKLKEADKKPINKMSDNKDGAGSADNESQKETSNTNNASALPEIETQAHGVPAETEIPSHNEEEPIVAQQVSFLEKIATMCHEANRAWCELHGDFSQTNWSNAEEWQRQSAIAGVNFRLENPSAGKDAQHNAWMESKIKDGWIFGEKKDADAKTHPCIVPFDKLPEFQQKKDALFCAIVDSLK